MKEIICRFDNIEDLNKLSNIINFELSTEILEFDLDTLTLLKVKSKKPFKKDTIDKHDCSIHYVNMPEFLSKSVDEFHKIVFFTNKDSKELGDIFEQNFSDKTKSVWYPKLIMGKNSKYRVVSGDTKHKYPIYVISKGRYDCCSTSKFLTQMEVKHYVVVEPQEYEIYNKNVSNTYSKVMSMDLSYKDNYDTFDDLGTTKSTGPGAARNYCWEHSITKGYKWHWVFDDNATEGFHWLYQNSKIKCRTGTFFRVIEEFCDRYDNLAISGLNYSKFCKEVDKVPPFVKNTRIYSFLLIRNDIPYRWRGRYNEDTDLSLRVLKDGWCTVQFNSLLGGKATTQKVKGGNTEEFYIKEGTHLKSKMIQDMHPDLVTVVEKFNRCHHQVDYSVFKTKLKLKDGIDLSNLPTVNNYGMKIIYTDEDNTNDTKSYLENKYNELINNNIMPVLNLY